MRTFRGDPATLAARIETIVLTQDGSVAVSYTKGYVVGEEYTPISWDSLSIPAAQADPFMAQPGDPARTRRDDLDRVVCDYLVAQGIIVGTVTDA